LILPDPFRCSCRNADGQALIEPLPVSSVHSKRWVVVNFTHTCCQAPDPVKETSDPDLASVKCTQHRCRSGTARSLPWWKFCRTAFHKKGRIRWVTTASTKRRIRHSFRTLEDVDCNTAPPVPFVTPFAVAAAAPLSEPTKLNCCTCNPAPRQRRRRRPQSARCAWRGENSNINGQR